MIVFYIFVVLSLVVDGFRMTTSSRVNNLRTLEMTTAIKGGSIVALATPMTNTNAIDYNKLIDLLKWHISQKTDGVVILGTTGESSTISSEERTKIIETSVKTVNGAIPVIVGTGTIECKKVIEMSKQAEILGADGVLVITPYYVKPPQRALVAHFNSIADAIKIPVILYNCQGRTGVNMSPETGSFHFIY
jgi:4-hydroxy-tetrahydrodipicolinate synthase